MGGGGIFCTFEDLITLYIFCERLRYVDYTVIEENPIEKYGQIFASYFFGKAIHGSVWTYAE